MGVNRNQQTAGGCLSDYTRRRKEPLSRMNKRPTDIRNLVSSSIFDRNVHADGTDVSRLDFLLFFF